MERYIRQIIFPFIGEEGQKKLLKSRVTVVGAGALGTVVSNNLARAGIGNLKIIDRDYVELSNLQRQLLYTEKDAKEGIPKAVASKEKLKEINSEINIEGIVSDVNSKNIKTLLDGSHVVVDATDNFSIRFLINDYCVKNNIPWVYGGVIASYGMTMTIIPGETPCFRCFIETPPPPGSQPTCETAGVLAAITGVVGNIEAIEAIKLIVDKEKTNRDLLSIDLWNGDFNKINVKRNESCPACSRGEFDFLNNTFSETTSMCGRDSVQVMPNSSGKVQLDIIAKGLKGVGDIQLTPFLLRFKVDDTYLVTLFPDGRAIIKGTQDPTKARVIYTQYIGM